MESPPTGISVTLANGSDLYNWKVHMQGPESSPYNVCIPPKQFTQESRRFQTKHIVPHTHPLLSTQAHNSAHPSLLNRAANSSSTSPSRAIILSSRRRSPLTQKSTTQTSPTMTREVCVLVCLSPTSGSPHLGSLLCWNLRGSCLSSRCRMTQSRAALQSSTAMIGRGSMRLQETGRGSMPRGSRIEG